MSSYSSTLAVADFNKVKAQWQDAQHLFKALIADILAMKSAIARAEQSSADDVDGADKAFTSNNMELIRQGCRTQHMHELLEKSQKLKSFLSEMEHLRRDHLDRVRTAAFFFDMVPPTLGDTPDTLPRDDIDANIETNIEPPKLVEMKQELDASLADTMAYFAASDSIQPDAESQLACELGERSMSSGSSAAPQSHVAACVGVAAAPRGEKRKLEEHDEWLFLLDM